MKKAIATIVEIGHANLENNNPITREEIRTFECVGSHPHWRLPKEADEFLKQIQRTFYSGYDNKIYPQFEVEIRTVD